jgi:hypothetical protein
MLASSRAHAAGPVVLQFTASSANSGGDTIYFNDPALNGKKHLKLIVTQRWTGIYNDHPIGVYLTGSTWAAFNEDRADMPVGASFNVTLGTSEPNATPLNSADYYTVLAAEKNNPSGILLLTHNWNPYPNIGGTYVDHNLGVLYSNDFKKWLIFNEDFTPPIAAVYNLLDATKNKNAFIQATTSSNIDGGDGVYIDNSLSAGHPNAVVFVTPSGATWNHPLGVYYAGGEWDIFNQDGTTMPAGLTFNVLIYSGTNP